METIKSNNPSLFKTYTSYISLSKYLFAQDDKGIYNMNEIPKDNEFYSPAREIAKELNISWENMTHEESNRIMLALLEDTYNAMRTMSESDKLEIHVNLKVIK